MGDVASFPAPYGGLQEERGKSRLPRREEITAGLSLGMR